MNLTEDQQLYVQKTVWGIGADDRIDKSGATKKTLSEWAYKIKKAQGGKQGHQCVSIFSSDNKQRDFDIEFAFYDNSYSPQGSSCEAK
ncbi:hypothetical protein PSN45_002901 [Yamadazyma tenuis]|uniref:uncharacterized protein n=1 Tax=Candida tenuis TaxID=2315449 RepID=UPI0027A70B3A|nr:hypothetical protein PSN45_002901 [Yamadazyma tenuis]